MSSVDFPAPFSPTSPNTHPGGTASVTSFRAVFPLKRRVRLVTTAIGADGRIPSSDQKTTFAPRDTVYVSVVTDKPPAGATLSARWTYEDGQLVSENRESLTSAARNATEFHISKPDGWPPGRYQVEIALNGQPAGSREFEVR